MGSRLYRSIDEPIRDGLNWAELWMGPDRGLIYCWEHDAGELVPLDWKGGVREKSKMEKKLGTFNYLATWQGLRGEDLDLPLSGERAIECTRTGQVVVFSARVPDEE